MVKSNHDFQLSIGIYGLGLVLALIQWGTLWFKDQPPWSWNPSPWKWILVLVAITLPAIFLILGTWSLRKMRLWSLGLILITGVFLSTHSTDFVYALLDLWHGKQHCAAIYMDHYDCSDYQKNFKIMGPIRTCVDLEWITPKGQFKKDRYIIPQSWIQGQSFYRGECLDATFWTYNNHLINLKHAKNLQHCYRALEHSRHGIR